MSAKHGTRRCYVGGCHCDACKAANRNYERERVARWANGLTRPVVAEVAPSGPGPVETAIRQEIEGLALAAARPSLVETAVSLGKILDNPRAISQQPAAAGKLVDILDTLHKRAVPRGGLKLVRAMTAPDGGA
jgi:hypothetical protein